MSNERIWGGRTLAERQAERREALINAAIELVGEHGARAMTTKAVCVRAGSHERYLYESFSSRDDLLLAAFDRCLQETTAELLNVYLESANAPLVDRIRSVLAFGMELAAVNPGRVRLLFLESVSDPVLRERAESLHTTIESLCLRAIEEAGAPGDHTDHQIMATMLGGGCIQTVIAWASGRLDADTDHLVTAATKQFAAMLGQPQHVT